MSLLFETSVNSQRYSTNDFWRTFQGLDPQGQVQGLTSLTDSDPRYIVYSNLLPVSDTMRDLGITVDCNPKFDRGTYLCCDTESTQSG